MIRFWLDQRFSFSIPDNQTFKDGSVKLSSMVWLHDMYDWSNVKIGVGLLSGGYKI